MPRNPLKTFRRKSSGNALELTSEAPATSTFRVLERPDNAAFDGGAKTGNGRPVGRPFQNTKIKSVDNLALSTNRGSNSTTHSAGSGYAYDTSGSSARYSSTSTLPSSFEQEIDQENGELYPVRKANTAPMSKMATPEPPAPTFSARAGRALSFGLRSNRNSTVNLLAASTPPPMPQLPLSSISQPVSPAALKRNDSDWSRDRAMTTSSYASTARPPQIDNDFGSSDDFENMFENLSGPQKRANNIPPVPPLTHLASNRSGYTDDYFNSSVGQSVHDSEAMFPPRLSSKTGEPSPTLLERPKTAESRRYSWDSRKSNENLISAPSSGMGSPASENFPPPAPLPGFSSIGRGYESVPNRYVSPEPGDARASPTSNSGFLSAQSYRSTDQIEPPVPEETSEEALVWKSQLRRPTGEHDKRDARLSPNVLDTSALRSPRMVAPDTPSRETRDSPFQASTELSPSYGRDSQTATPRAKKAVPDVSDDSLFDSSPVGPSSRAINPGKQRQTTPGLPRRMTRVQFEQAQMHQDDPYDRNAVEDGKSTNSEDDEAYEDEDESDRHKKLAAQRRKQEATMSVYRQQMKKVTGGTISDLPSQTPRPGVERSALSGLGNNMSSMHLGGATVTDAMAGEEEDDEVPLGILQAHGFPTKSRPPTQLSGASPGYAASAAGGGAGDSLPAFARRLPLDPYFGAGLVNPPNRESLAFGNGGGSVYGGSGGPAQPGGLVGVIAGEEIAKAARRGSPNPITGGYGPMPLPNNMQAGPQAFQRSSSMASLGGPQMAMGGFMPQMGQLPGMPAMSPAEHATISAQQQMAQMMQMQTQMMQQMMAMQAGQMPNMSMPGTPFFGPSPSMGSLHPGNGFMPPNANQRPMSGAASNYSPSMAAGRTMSMTNPMGHWNNNENMQQRSNTMGSSSLLNKPNYAGSVYGMNLAPNGPGAGYTPSIAPSERSNIGMPSRYRPVSTLDTSAAQQIGGLSGRTTPSPGLAPPQMQNEAATPKQAKSTIRVIDKPKSAGKLNSFFSRNKQSVEEEEDDDEGWAEMKRKREALKQKRAKKGGSDGAMLSELYQGYE